jgi:2-dehydro-3-deoxygluconokinase
MNNIYVFGECMIELRAYLALDSSLNDAPSKILKQSFAGDVLNTAVYLKRSFPELNTHFVSALGKDKFSREMLTFFQQEQIGSELVFQSENKIPGLYAIETDASGERTFSYWRENSAAKDVMSFIDDAAIKQLCSADMFFFSGISLAVIKPEDRLLFWQMLEKIQQAGVSIIFDPNYRARMWDSAEQAKAQFERAFSMAEVALPGVDDFAQLYGIDSSEAVYAFCRDFNFKELIIKNGEAGILCYIDERVYQFHITPVSDVVDTTSAGDSFNGVYLGARAKGLSINHAIELASKAAGFVIQHQGAIVDKHAFQQFMQPKFR